MSTRWRASGRALHTKTPRGGVVLHLVSKAYFVLNDTGEALWPALETGATEDELVGIVCREFDVGSDRARLDVVAWLRELASATLIEPCDAVG